MFLRFQLLKRISIPYSAIKSLEKYALNASCAPQIQGKDIKNKK